MKNAALLLVFFIASAFAPADTVLTRFAVPTGFKQVATAPGSFAAWLQQRPLKPKGTRTLTYTDQRARTDEYTAAVLDMSIGKRDLQQCADAVIRLRAEYLFEKKAYSSISFNFTSGFKCDYDHYTKGYRYQQNGTWKKTAKEDRSYENFLRYLDLVFSYAGTLSLNKELNKVTNPNDLQIGDVFIHGGSPGHCFIVMNAAVDKQGKKRFILAQSFMPAQNIQIVQNGSPWFGLDTPAAIPYGELVNAAYLKRF